ncbi:hypothetical protein SARC_03183 [Sphaeroforma arctica JP610]|uniref:JmjC domain-containing protein n=1 Tax=Sphaeroforma arctica JP610 TaxID=667725 RepID=A0A0L0G6X7_9EUKA|nr:hypothetical protein SARC_03183 [Sphaeroforma arctica JP610]KNC84616.1 hypothetical protein SARC_03183 [Sphaeroforma arctica JP610]|eukprot:XP_014158518.1 hypothetical protein SARC_03183 [Sphaeroforma arctica JP610]
MVVVDMSLSITALSSHVCHPHRRTYKLVLNEGDVLFVPRHWWHAVHSDTTSIAINMWVETAEDHAERVNESVVRLLATGLMAWTGDKSTEPRQSGVRMDPVDEQRGPDQPGASIRQTVQSEKVGLTNSPRSTNAYANRQDWMNTGETQLEADECVALVNEAIKSHLRHRGNSSGSHNARLSRDTSETNNVVASSSHGAGANFEEKVTSQHSEPTQTPVKNHGYVHKRHTTPEAAINSSAKRRKPNLYDQMTTEAGYKSSTMPYDRSAIKTDDNPLTTTYEMTTTDTEDTAKPTADTHPTTHADNKSSHNIDVSAVTPDIESTVSTDEKYTTTSSTLVALSPEKGTVQQKVDLSLTQITNAIVSDPTVVQAISRALVRLYESESARQ